MKQENQPMKMCLFFTAVVFAQTAFAQTAQTAGIVYQQAQVIGVPGGLTIRVPDMAGPEILGPEAVTGSPLAATHQSHSLQVLSDGTRIERNESQQIYRDSMGRTRTENGPAGAGVVMIQDPVAGTMVALDPATKTAQKMPAPRALKLAANGAVTAVQAQFAVAGGGPVSMQSEGPMQKSVMIARAGGPDVGAVTSSKPVVEDLPSQSINGVLATGRRTTLTIPAGEIGNDRPIQVASETWFSSDLQMVVKSSNSDPRFGDTSFELINIGRNEPDSSLFQIPADYTMTEGKMMKFKTLQSTGQSTVQTKE
jgi:hypothetical protein